MELTSNTTFQMRMSRLLNHGAQQLLKSRTNHYENNHITYYVLDKGAIVSFREWYQLNRPDFVISGNKKKCIDHSKKLVAL